MKIDASFPHDAFQFIHLPIRQEDAKNRNFLERFYIGIQHQFEDTQLKINSVIKLIDPKETPDFAIKYLKDHVGFTKELDYITQGLSNDELRKLIILAVPLWRQKGLEIGYKNIVRLFTGAGSRVFNWFDFRLIVGEKALGEEQLGEDSWLISQVGEPTELDEFQTDIRVVDNGHLNKDLLLKVLNLMRPVSERLNVIYIRYFEDFSAGKGTLRTITGVSQIFEENLQIQPGSVEYSDLENQENFKDIHLTTAVIVPAQGEFGIRFNVQNENDYYRVVADTATSMMRLERVVSGTPTILHGPSYVDMVPDRSYILTVSTFFDDVSDSTKIKYFHDSNLVGEVVDSVFTSGGFGYDSVGDVSTIKEIEMYLKPLLTNRINPNFEVL